MDSKVIWGILSTAKIGTQKVIPAMQKGRYCEIKAIASRNKSSAEETAMKLNIPQPYGSYQELLDDPEIQAVYIPLPNHMHAEWAVKAMYSGKHVLCEKPLALTIKDIRTLIEARDENNVKAGEAFMVNCHPQWQSARQIIKDGSLGNIRTIQGFFSYFNNDPGNIRNIADYGGGGLWDIGCYPVHCSRYLMGTEPDSVTSVVKYDKSFNTDYLASAVLDFGGIISSFTSSTQAVNSQSMTVYGDKSKLEILIPFNAPPDRETFIYLDRDALMQKPGEKIVFPAYDQYTLQGDAFSKAILDDTEVPVPFEDSLKNSAVILAAFLSAQEGRAVNPAELL